MAKRTGTATGIRGLRKLLTDHGYSPSHAMRLANEGMGTTELEGRLRIPANEMGGLTYTHGIHQSSQPFRKGERVQLHPATDRWMMGDRYGVVTSTRLLNGKLRVKLDKSNRSFSFSPRDVLPID